MTDTLISEAPEGDEAASAPEVDTAVTDDSVSSTEVTPKEKVVDAARFNGLQSKYQSDKAAWDAEKAAMRTEMERLTQESQTTKEPELSDDVMDEVRALRDELAIERKSNALARALEAHPGAKPLADLIVADNPADIMKMAEVLEQRLSGLAPVADAADADADATDVSSDADAEADEAPVLGGAAEYDSNVPVDEAIEDAVTRQDFGAFFRAAEARAVQGTDTTVG